MPPCGVTRVVPVAVAAAEVVDVVTVTVAMKKCIRREGR